MTFVLGQFFNMPEYYNGFINRVPLDTLRIILQKW
jgi:hypothetical protein